MYTSRKDSIDGRFGKTIWYGWFIVIERYNGNDEGLKEGKGYPYGIVLLLLRSSSRSTNSIKFPLSSGRECFLLQMKWTGWITPEFLIWGLAYGISLFKSFSFLQFVGTSKTYIDTVERKSKKLEKIDLSFLYDSIQPTELTESWILSIHHWCSQWFGSWGNNYLGWPREKKL